MGLHAIWLITAGQSKSQYESIVRPQNVCPNNLHFTARRWAKYPTRQVMHRAHKHTQTQTAINKSKRQRSKTQCRLRERKSGKERKGCKAPGQCNLVAVAMSRMNYDASQQAVSQFKWTLPRLAVHTNQGVMANLLQLRARESTNSRDKATVKWLIDLTKLKSLCPQWLLSECMCTFNRPIGDNQIKANKKSPTFFCCVWHHHAASIELTAPF